MPDERSRGALAGIRVIECAEGVSGPFCGKAFADLGADVIKVESPRGDRSRRDGPFPGDIAHPEKSGRFLYLNSNKRSIVLDLESPGGRADLRALARDGDLLIAEGSPSRLTVLGLDSTLLDENPQLVLTCLSPYGQVGPYREYRGNDLTSYHLGGLGRETPYNQVQDLEAEPPLVGGGFQSEYLTGWTAAAVSLAALAFRDRSGKGQAIDLGALESVASMMRISLAGVSYTGRIVIQRKKNGFGWVQPCRDGHVSISPASFDHWWARFKKMAGEPDWADMEVFSSILSRLQNADVVEALIDEWLSQRTKREIFELALAHGVPGFPVHSMGEVVAAEQLRAREFFVEVEHPVAGRVKQPGAPARYSKTPWSIRRPAPLLGEHTRDVLDERAAGRVGAAAPPARSRRSSDRPTSSLPLEGIRVADFGWILAVPHATAWLGCLGAEVIRIESRARLDLVRVLPGTAADGQIGVNRAGAFNGLSYSKKSVTLNLSSERGVELAREIIAKSDVVTENFTPGVMQRLGLDYASLSRRKPDLVMLSGSPLGQTGPHRHATGWGPNTQAFAGLPYLTGYAGGPPVGLGGFYPDFMVGVAMAFSIMAALRHRDRTGEGQHVEFAMAETVAAMIPDALLDYTMNGREAMRRGNRHPAMAPHGVYRCQGDDQWVSIAVTDDEAWRALRSVLGDPQWARDPELDRVDGRLARHDEIDARVSEWTGARTHYDVMHRLQAAGVAAAACLDALELAADPQLRALGLMVGIDHPEVGSREVAGLPGRFTAMPRYAYGPAPLLGQHNQEVLCGLLGVSDSDLDRLQREQVVF